MGSQLTQHLFSGTPWSPQGPANYAPWELFKAMQGPVPGARPAMPVIPPQALPGPAATPPPRPRAKPPGMLAPQGLRQSGLPERHGMLNLRQSDLPERHALPKTSPARDTAAEAAPARSPTSTQSEFVAMMSANPGVTQAAAQLGVPKEWLIAQAALETGWGRSAPGHNLFGIKAFGGGPSTEQSTWEVVNGKVVRGPARFRAYEDAAGSASDYASLITRRYADAVGADTPEAYFGALKRGGYATDPDYVRKVVAIARQLGA